MSNDRQKRPDPREIIARAPPARKAEIAAELSRPDVQRTLQKGEGGLDSELAAQLAPQFGNDAVKDMILGSTTASAAAGSKKGAEGAQQEQGEESDEELEVEAEQEVEAQGSLPSFSGPTGAVGASPWAMGRFFGGDGDDAAGLAGPTPGRWRPMPSLAEPEDAPDGSVDASDPDDVAADSAWLGEARRELGKAPWRSGLLARGLRDPTKLCRARFKSESLDEQLDSAFGRARASLRLLADHAEVPAARRLAWTLCGAGAAVAPAAMGYSGATARALHGLDAVLQILPNRQDWERVLEVRLCVNARALAEQHADRLEVGTLGAVRIFESIFESIADVYEDQGVVEPMLDLQPHPAAVEALEAASALRAIPIVEPWVWHTEELVSESEEIDELDRVLCSFTGGPEATGSGLVARHHLGPLFACLNSLLDALGLAQVELAAAAVAALQGGVGPEHALATIRGADEALVRMARRLVRVGRAIEALIGTGDTEGITALSWEAVAIREGVDLARRSAIIELATQVACITGPLVADAELESLVEAFADGDFRVGSFVEATDLLPGAALRAGRPGAALEHLAHGHFEPVSIALSLRIALGLLNDAPVGPLSEQLYAHAEQERSVFALVEAAIALTTSAKEDPFAPLRRAAAWMRKRKRGDALSLLIARWGELRLGSEPADEEADE